MMRRILCMLAVFCLAAALFFGCAAKGESSQQSSRTEPPASAAQGFTRCEVAFTYGEITGRAELEKRAAGSYMLTMLEPQTLKSMTASFEDDTVTLSYMGFESRFSLADLPDAAFAAPLFEALDQITLGEDSEFLSQNDEIEILYDAQTGLPQTIRSESLGFEAVLSNFS